MRYFIQYTLFIHALSSKFFTKGSPRLINTIKATKYIELRSLRYLFRKGYMEIKLGSEKRRIVITIQDLGKFLVSILYGMFQYLLHTLKDNLERVFCRKKWVSMKYFEFAGLINSYITALDAKDSNIQRERLVKFREKAAIVLKNYKWKIFRRYKKVELQPDSMLEFLYSMYRVALIVYSELKQIRRAHNSITHMRVFLRAFATRFSIRQTN